MFNFLINHVFSPISYFLIILMLFVVVEFHAKIMGLGNIVEMYNIFWKNVFVWDLSRNLENYSFCNICATII